MSNRITAGVSHARLVELAVRLAAPAAEVWRAIVEPELAPRWMGMRITCTWEVGSAITITDTPLGPRYRERGTLLAFEPGTLLRFDHFSELWRVPDAPENRAVMTMRVEPDGDASRLSLRHELPAVEAIAEHSAFFWRGGLYQLHQLLAR